MPKRPTNKKQGKIKQGGDVHSFTSSLVTPLPFFEVGAVVKVTAGEALGLAVITGKTELRPFLGLSKLPKSVQHDGKSCSWEAVLWNRDAHGKPLGVIRSWALPVQTKEEAWALLPKLAQALRDDHQRKLGNHKEYTAMRTVELSSHKAQWAALKDGWPRTVKAVESGLEAAKDFNAETVALTGSSILPIEAGDTEALAKLFKAQSHQGELDAVNAELSVNWIGAGYCNMKPEEYTAKINAKLGTNLSVAAMKGRAVTKLGLVSGRSVGRPINEGDFSVE